MRNLNRSAYTYRRFRAQNKAKNESTRDNPNTQDAIDSGTQSSAGGALPEKDWLETYYGALPYGVLLLGKRGEILFANTAFGNICACDVYAEGFLGMDVQHLLAKLGLEPGNREDSIPPSEFTTLESRVIACSAHPLDFKKDTTASAVELWIFNDITEERAAADQLVYLAEHDMLTGLYNRHRFQEELAHQMKVADRQKTALALLYIDLDNFKSVNDSMGHRAGDELLKLVAQQLVRQVRSNEFLARIGGDEFAVLIPSANDLAVRTLHNRIRTAVSGASDDYLRGSKINCSIGMAFYPADASSENELMAKADAAMYETKPARHKIHAAS